MNEFLKSDNNKKRNTSYRFTSKLKQVDDVETQQCRMNEWEEVEAVSNKHKNIYQQCYVMRSRNGWKIHHCCVEWRWKLRDWSVYDLENGSVKMNGIVKFSDWSTFVWKLEVC